MNRIFYMMSIILISFFVISCSEEEESIAGAWSGDDFEWDFSITFVDSSGTFGGTPMEEVELSCSSALLQNNSDLCTMFPCNYINDGCEPQGPINFSESGTVVTAVFAGDVVTFSESWYDDYNENGEWDVDEPGDECISIGTWATSEGLLDMTSTTLSLIHI